MSLRSRIRQRSQDDRGASLLVMLLVIVAVVAVAGLVVDLGSLRNRKTTQRFNADTAAIAGAAVLTKASATAACTTAWNFVKSNGGIDTASVSQSPNCGAFNAVCDPTTARTVTAVFTGGTVAFISPVPNNSTLMTGQTITTRDGVACDRFAVQITRTNANLINAGSINTTVSAVAVHSTADYVTSPLVVLDPHACNALLLRSTADLNAEATLTTPGHIIVDSDGANCTGSDRILVTDNSSQVVAEDTTSGALGVISMYALTVNAPRAFSNTDQASSPDDHGIYPTPVASTAPTGRLAIDRRYNCQPSNGCTDTAAPYIDNLKTALNSGTPSGYTTWSFGCSPSGYIPTGNYYVPSSVCPNGLAVASNTVLTFGAGSNLVMDKGFNNQSNGTVSFNCSTTNYLTCDHEPSTTGVIYVRSGAIWCGDGNFEFWGTFVYANGSPSACIDGLWQILGTRHVYWTAPLSGPFEDLTLWCEGTMDVTVRANSGLLFEGTFFVPNARLHLENSNITDTQHAQFLIGTMFMEGNSRLSLDPDIDRSTLLSTNSANNGLLIR